MKRQSTYLSASPAETERIAAEIAADVKPGDYIALFGEMGAGKTVFVKGVAKAFGIEDEIVSPTYAYMNDYQGKLYHYDCYRLQNGGQAEALGLTDYFYADGVCLIEWAENIESVLPPHCKKVTIRKTEENRREITVE